MQYAKQKPEYILPFDIAHTELGLAESKISYTVESIVAGRIKNVILDMDQTGFNQLGGVAVVVTREKEIRDTEYYELIESFQASTRQVMITTNDVAFVYMINASTSIRRFHSKKSLVDIGAGDVIYVHFFFEMFADPTAGNLSGTLKFELDVFKMKSYKHNKPSYRGNWKTNYFWVTGDAPDNELIWAPPCDGWIGNVRITAYGDMTELDEISLSKGSHKDTVYTIDTIEAHPKKPYYLRGGAPDTATDYVESSAYFSRREWVEGKQPWYLKLEGSTFGNICVEFTFIPQFGNRYDINYNMIVADTEEGVPDYIYIPFDVYLGGIEYDLLVANLDGNFLYFYGFKPPWDMDNIAGLTTQQGEIFKLEQSIEGVMAANLLDKVTLVGTRGGGTVANSQGLIQVQDFYPAGSIIMYLVGGVLEATETVSGLIKVITKIQGSRSKYMGTNYLQSNQMRLLSGDEVLDL